MTIRMEITGETPEEIAQSIVSMAFIFGMTSAPQAKQAVEPAAEPAKRTTRGKKAEVTIDHDATETKADVHTAGGATVDDADSATASAGASDEPADSGQADALVRGEGSDSEAPADIEAAGDSGATDPEMSVDELRKYVIGNYLNACFATQDERTAAFRELLGHFRLQKIGDTPADKINEFKALVDVKIAEKAKG